MGAGSLLVLLNCVWYISAEVAEYCGTVYDDAGNDCFLDALAMSTAPQVTTAGQAAQEWKDLLEEILPPQGAWSEDEYLVLTDHRNRLIEFTDGFLEALPMPTDKHQSVLQFLFLAFFQYLVARGGKVHFAPLRLRVRPGKFREPDLVLLISAGDARGKTGSGSVPISLWKW